MTSQTQPIVHRETYADVVRVVLALGLLAFLASFDGADKSGAAEGVQTTRAALDAVHPK